MATKYVWSGAGGSGTGDDWTNAYTTFAAGLAALSAAGDILKVQKTHSENYSGDTTLTFQNSIRVVCVDKDASDAPSTGAVVGGSATNYHLTLACSGERKIFIHGVSFSNGTGALSRTINVFQNDQAHIELSSVNFLLNTGSASRVIFGLASSAANIYVRWSGSVKFGATTQYLDMNVGRFDFQGVSVDPAGSAPAELFFSSSTGVFVTGDGCDFSHNGSGYLVGDSATAGIAVYSFSNSKVGAGPFLEAPATVTNKGNASISLLNCSNADTHYVLYHSDSFGTTEVSAAIYANDGAQYDGTNRCSWVITTRASNASFFTPYVSPWIDKYHAGTSAITPSLEILRDGSATAYQDDEVWGEFSYQGTTGYPQAVFVNDRMALLGTPANQAAGAGLSNWTGETTTGAPDAWSGKLAPASTITPAEIGHLRARVVVGEPGITVYVDPKIRIA